MEEEEDKDEEKKEVEQEKEEEDSTALGRMILANVSCPNDAVKCKRG